MEEKKKKRLIKAGVAVLVIVVILNIPIVSDVIAVTRVGMIDRAIAIEKIEYDGKTHNLFVFEKFSIYEEYGETVAYAVENNILRAKVRVWEPATGNTTYLVKPLLGRLYQEETEHFEPGEEPRENKQ